MAVNVVSFSFSWCSTWGPGAHSAGCCLSLLHLISNFSGPQTPSGFPRASSAGCGFPYHTSSITPSPTLTGTGTQLSSVLTELYNSSTPTRLPTRSLKSHVWSSSSGNNGHAVHRSLSSGASVYECTMRIFFTSSYFISQFPPTRFSLITAIRMCHLLPVHHLGMAFLAGSKAKIQQFELAYFEVVVQRFCRYVTEIPPGNIKRWCKLYYPIFSEFEMKKWFYDQRKGFKKRKYRKSTTLASKCEKPTMIHPDS